MGDPRTGFADSVRWLPPRPNGRPTVYRGLDMRHPGSWDGMISRAAIGLPVFSKRDEVSIAVRW